MAKARLNISMDQDLIEFVKIYAEENRTTVADVLTQFLMNLKRQKTGDPTELILSDKDFSESMLFTIEKLRTGKAKWYSYKDVFGE